MNKRNFKAGCTFCRLCFFWVFSWSTLLSMFLSIPLKRAIIPLPRLTMGQVCTTIPTSFMTHIFFQAIRNTFILVVITVPLSTLLALLISVALSSVKALKKLFQTIYFLPYVTNTLAVGLVFMILFKKTAYSDGLINLVLNCWTGTCRFY